MNSTITLLPTRQNLEVAIVQFYYKHPIKKKGDSCLYCWFYIFGSFDHMLLFDKGNLVLYKNMVSTYFDFQSENSRVQVPSPKIFWQVHQLLSTSYSVLAGLTLKTE